MSTWYSAVVDDPDEQERLTDAWIDAPVENLETCAFILDIARDQVWAYAPESEDEAGEYVAPPEVPDDVPSRLVYAQLKQAQNLWNAGRVASSGDVGVDGFSYTPRPMDKTIRGLIRHSRGTFNVG